MRELFVVLVVLALVVVLSLELVERWAVFVGLVVVKTLVQLLAGWLS